MKKSFCVGLAVVLALGLSFGSAHAIWLGDKEVKLSGPHWQFNLKGHPNPKGAEGCIAGDDSSGRAIMIPLVTKPCSDCEPLDCDGLAGGVTVTDDEVPTYFETDPAKGVKLYFTAGEGPEDFEIVDRDVCDGRGEIVIPTYDVDGTPYLAVDVYVRVLGKPNQCMRINGYAEDETQGLWFWSGTVTLKRMPGKSTFEKINELFLVWWCDVCDEDDVLQGACTDTDLGLCIAGTEEELSVFDDQFAGYLWDIENNGARTVQVRLYPRTSPYLPE